MGFPEQHRWSSSRTFPEGSPGPKASPHAPSQPLEDSLCPELRQKWGPARVPLPTRPPRRTADQRPGPQFPHLEQPCYLQAGESGGKQFHAEWGAGSGLVPACAWTLPVPTAICQRPSLCCRNTRGGPDTLMTGITEQ